MTFDRVHLMFMKTMITLTKKMQKNMSKANKIETGMVSVK